VVFVKYDVIKNENPSFYADINDTDTYTAEHEAVAFPSKIRRQIDTLFPHLPGGMNTRSY